MIPDTLDHATQCEQQMYKNNYKAINLITTALGRNVYDKVAHLETAHVVWLKLCNTYESSSEIKSSCRGTYNRQYKIFSQKLGELIALLALSRLLAAYVHVVLLLILIMNVLNNCYMLLMILYGT
jgi:hypothetical protein